MARLEDALKVRPKGWSVSEEYIAPRELEIVAVLKRKEAEKKRAAQQAAAELEAAEAAAEAARIKKEEEDLQLRAALDAQLERSREQVLRWMGDGAAI